MFTHAPAGDGISLYFFCIITLILTWMFASLRIWVRVGILKAAGPDDYMMMAAVACWTWFSIAAIILPTYGLGRHVDTVPVQDVVKFFKLFFIAELGYVIAVGFLRVSVCFFYLRLTPIRWHIWTIRTVTVATLIMTMVYFLVVLLQCLPVSFFWRQAGGATDGHCRPSHIIIGTGYAHNTVSIITDWVLNILPLFFIGPAQMSKRIKVIVLALLGLGLLASIASIIRFPALRGLAAHGDFTYNSSGIAFWSAVEGSVGILAACAATFKPLFRKLLGRGPGESSGDGVSSRANATPKSLPWKRVTSSSRRINHRAGYLLSGMGQDAQSFNDQSSTGELSTSTTTVVNKSYEVDGKGERYQSHVKEGVIQKTEHEIV